MRRFEITTHCLDTTKSSQVMEEKVTLSWTRMKGSYSAGVAGSSCVRQMTGAGTIPKAVAHYTLNNLSNELLFLMLRALQVNISEEVL